MPTHRFFLYHIIFFCLTLLSPASVAETMMQENQVIEVIGVTPTHGVGLPKALIPYNVQTATSKELDESHALSVADFMNLKLGSVTINDAQNNPLQPDVQYRGYTLSPLLGLPQGLAVFQDGVRINEPFGDAMNWDLLPESAIANINLIGGANPIFGLNALGGSLSITTKNGFTHPGQRAEISGGSFGRVVGTVESGGNNNNWGYFITANYFDEDGWRDASPSDAINVFGAISHRSANTTLDLTYNYADTDLIGNGASPVELLELDRDAVFTSPDQTENQLSMINFIGTHQINEGLQLSGNAFYRKNKTHSFNGDGSEFEACEDPNNEDFLCEEGEDEPIEDQFGNTIAEDNDNGTERNAINNISRRDQESFGANIQATLTENLFGKKNQLIVGGGYQKGLIDFFSTVEIASLNCEFQDEDCTLVNADRGTTRTGIFVPEEGTEVKAHHRVFSLYVTDTMSLTDKLSMTASARYNNSNIVIGERDNSALAENDPGELNGDHTFNRINPAFGLTYQMNDAYQFYGNYSESSRTPTPVELLCSHEDAPCNLPNAFLADPPLEQVVTKSFEGGIRGRLSYGINYYVNGFHSTNEDDIIFGSTGGTTSSTGFFRNVGDTQRVGLELGLSGLILNDKLQWYANYSLVHATFEDRFIGISANHPEATDLNGDGDADEIQVEAGDKIPGIPKHSLKLGGTYAFNDRFSLGSNIIYNSSQVLRGDESNQLDAIDGYAIVNINATYKINRTFSFFIRANNIFDTDYETFGLLGEADEVFDGSGAAAEFENAAFLGPGAPINAFAGISLVF